MMLEPLYRWLKSHNGEDPFAALFTDLSHLAKQQFISPGTGDGRVVVNEGPAIQAKIDASIKELMSNNPIFNYKNQIINDEFYFTVERTDGSIHKTALILSVNAKGKPTIHHIDSAAIRGNGGATCNDYCMSRNEEGALIKTMLRWKVSQLNDSRNTTFRIDYSYKRSKPFFISVTTSSIGCTANYGDVAKELYRAMGGNIE